MKEIDPKSTSRALAFELWMKAPMPMVTLMKTLDVTALVRMSRKKGYKFNMLLCWCIGKTAARTEDFYLLPVGDKLMEYDRLAINTVVATRDGAIATCDIPVSDDLEQFNRDYRKLTGQVRESGEGFVRASYCYSTEHIKEALERISEFLKEAGLRMNKGRSSAMKWKFSLKSHRNLNVLKTAKTFLIF